MIKLNYELLAICFNKKTLCGATAVTKAKRDESRCKKHLFKGKTTKRRNKKNEQEYGNLKSIVKQLSNIKNIKISMERSMIIDPTLTLEENLEQCHYTLQEAENEVKKFYDYFEIEVIYERKQGRYFDFRVYEKDRHYIKFN